MVRGRTNKKKAPAKPKRTKPPILDNTPIRDIQSLMVNDSFIYEVNIYKLVRNSYNLEDSKFIKGSNALDDDSSYTKNVGLVMRVERTMVAAPIEWLKQKGYRQ